MTEKTADTTVVAATLSAEEVESHGFDASATKKLLRKIDWHLLPFMSLIYL